MKLLLVRHGETVHNVAGVYAGSTDSALTSHGVQQIQRLGRFLADRVTISHIFSSDLQRAFKTAEAIRLAQPSPPAETVRCIALREKHYGFYEGKNFSEHPRSGRQVHLENDIESKESMDFRTDAFVEEHLIPLFNFADESAVVVVAHGIILNHLWDGIRQRFPKVSTMPGLQSRDLPYFGPWSNTGYLELEIRESTAPLIVSDSQEAMAGSAISDVVTEQTWIEAGKLMNKSLVVKAINSLEHLDGLKKTRGGIGSALHDEKQKTIDSFFKKPI